MENKNIFSTLKIEETVKAEDSKKIFIPIIKNNFVQTLQCKYCKNYISSLKIDDHQIDHQIFCKWCNKTVIDITHNEIKCRDNFTTICRYCKNRVFRNHNFIQCKEYEKLFTVCAVCSIKVRKTKISIHFKNEHAKEISVNKNEEKPFYKVKSTK